MMQKHSSFQEVEEEQVENNIWITIVNMEKI